MDDAVRGRRYLVGAVPGRWSITFHGAASFVVDEARAADVITVHPHGLVTDDTLAMLLTGPVAVTAALMRGHSLWHASAVHLDRAAPGLPAHVVGLVGPPGTGKSATAMMLSASGGALFSDDALRIDLAPGTSVQAHRGTIVSRLRSATLVGVGHGQRSATPDGRIAIKAARSAPEKGSLSMMLFPRLSPGYAVPRLRPAHPTEALIQLASALPIAGVSDKATLARHLHASRHLLDVIPHAVLEVPWDGSRPSPEMVGDLGAVVRDAISASPTDSAAAIVGGGQ